MWERLQMKQLSFCVHRADMQIIIFSFGICTLEALIPQPKCSKSCQLSKIRRPGFKYQFKSQIISQMSTSNTKKLHVRSKSVRIYTPYSFVGNVLVIFSRLKSTEQCCLLCNSSFQFFILHIRTKLQSSMIQVRCVFFYFQNLWLQEFMNLRISSSLHYPASVCVVLDTAIS